MHITSEEQLRAIVGDPHETVIKKAKTRLQDVHREWLAATPMIFVATSDADGRVDVSPKGDPAGKIAHVIDDRTIAIPERPGNRRVDGYLNILSNPRVGTISVIPGRGDTLRINGTARIVDDGPYFDDLAVRDQRPILAVEISTDEVYFHCAKAFLRSELWKPDTWRPDAVASLAQLTKRLMPEIADEIPDDYTEESFRPHLY
ncbi:pyridoxamine 5'-phosphate oxidase family protein [Gordonia bronchialis]|uniref:MSMEG_1061 family FMN-dependent PPOX-type flavoprotein n=1 Tax=Gordonia bronchialis TaxID=2054 RepID=UPI0005A54C8A|nr:MSMEG_1061 family FMN-dependent PPOX-type flavoprotein [Gordonia bronchialis]MCC3325447.1 pyridoxamine 5'-phosphate oxidase family protein [Gordonia bronchialis]QGS23868.1 pyridoxamine 5'-phosphate oxidase family protein [Gordonia bronchialis]UAK39955.1 pyridoxamine 5'-phosphate oxidase family protein [Gordonia bronchialis]